MMVFLIDSLIGFKLALDSFVIFNYNQSVILFKFGGYQVRDSIKLSTKEVSGMKNYEIVYKDNKVEQGRVYFEKGRSANYFLIFFERANWYAIGISEKPSSVWINDSVVDLIDGECFYKKLSKPPYKLKVIRNKFVILKEYNFK